MNKVQAFLEHYASEYYDPVKAHEYYERTKQLKGRTTSGMSDKQKEAWAYTKDQISTKKKSKIELEQEAKEKKIEQLRTSATEMRERISEKLKALSEKLTEDAESEREKVSEETKAKIEAVPKNLPPEKRAKLIAEIRDDASKSREGISKGTKAERKSASDNASGERKKLSTHLKKVITSARDEYKKTKVKIEADYEKISQDEYDNIMKNVPGKSKAKRRK